MPGDDLSAVDWSYYPSIYDTMQKNGWQVTDNVNDSIADIAAVLGGGYQQWAELSLIELGQWRARAIARNPYSNKG